ncbi:MAG: dihydroorotate dehydrogenase electron transfer subunit [Candidatus Omnitrophota bacterium]|jgi:dihydroorotate dehydrogenase electron transfer subunit
MMVDLEVKIEANERVNGKYYRLVFRSKPLAKGVLPGQFLNVQINPGSGDPFLRRPFSYYRAAPSGRIEILYEALGKGTSALARKKKGDVLKVMGPLGKPFTGRLEGGRKRVLVAGGVGVPPLIFLAEQFPSAYLLIGAKSKKEVLPKKQLALVKAKVLYSTDDGSYGRKGLVTRLFEDILRREGPGDLFIQTCGPMAMMRAVIEIARREKIPGEASLDKTMACGVGACLGCMVETTDGLVPSCTEGPVFGFERIRL